MKNFIVALILMMMTLEVHADCSPVSLGATKISATSTTVETRLDVMTKGHGATQTFLPNGGPGQKCLELEAFERERIVLARYRGGAIGTKALVQTDFLLAYKFSETGELSLTRTIELSQFETVGTKKTALAERDYSVKETKKGLEVVLKDLKTGAENSILLH